MNVVTLRRQWSALGVPALDDLTGDLAASFVAPLRHAAPPGLGVLGLRHWYGKRFVRDGAQLTGMNLLRADTGLVERLPMTAQLGSSLADGRPAVVVTYADPAPMPWRWVRDEIRVADGDTFVAMTFVDVPGLRRLGGTPFLLNPARPR